MPHPGSAQAVITELVKRGHTLAVAESLSGGALTAALVGVPGASAVLMGGVVAYQNEVKSHLLGVDSQDLDALGPVTESVAIAMAQGARTALEASAEATFGVATTGVAGPDPDPQTGQPPGLVFIAVAGSDGQVWSERLGLVGDRSQIREATVALALGLLEDALGISA
jgi:nicotinamide-nucleotide amidase